MSLFPLLHVAKRRVNFDTDPVEPLTLFNVDSEAIVMRSIVEPHAQVYVPSASVRPHVILFLLQHLASACINVLSPRRDVNPRNPSTLRAYQYITCPIRPSICNNSHMPFTRRPSGFIARNHLKCFYYARVVPELEVPVSRKNM
jgi:hypothetical protein